MSTVFRADFRRDTRYQRREVLASPYGRRPPLLKKQPKKEAPKTLWGYIKSWSFFAPPPDSDMSSSDEEVEVDDEAIQRPLSSRRSDHTHSSSSENSNSGNEGAATSGGSSNSSPSASSSRRALHPHKPVIAVLRPQKPKPMAPPARPADPVVVVRKKAQVTPVGPRPSSPPHQDGSNAEQEFVQLQVVKFLESKNGGLLTPEEFQQIRLILKGMVKEDAVEGDISLLESVMPKETEDGRITAVASVENPPIASSEKASDEQAATEDQTTEQAAEEESSSPARSTHGLPPFQLSDDGNSKTDEASTEDEEARWERRLKQRSVEIRKYLNLDYTDYNDVEGWEDLLRYKDVPQNVWTPEMREAYAIAHGLPEVPPPADVNMQHSSAESTLVELPKPEPPKPSKEAKPPKDFTKGYTPVEAMVNPYDRIAAFASRRKPHRLPVRKQRTVQPMDIVTESSDDSIMLPPHPPPEPPKELLGEINVLLHLKTKLATSYEDEPIAERPPNESEITDSGIAGDGKPYTAMKKRKAHAMYIEVDEDDGLRVLDGPILTMGPPPAKRRKSDEHSSMDDSDNNDGEALTRVVDVNLVNSYVLDEYEDHTPIKRTAIASAPPAASIPLEKRKWTPKIKSAKRGKGITPNAFKRTRSKTFLNPPINPSPLRNGTKSSGRKLLSKRLLCNAVPKGRVNATSQMPSYEFDSSSPRTGSIGPIRASRDMVKAKREVNTRKPYTLSEYRRVFKHLNKSPKSTQSSLVNIDVAATLISKKPSKKPHKVNGNHAAKPTPKAQEEKRVPAPQVAEIVEVFDIQPIASAPTQNGLLPGAAGGKKGKEYHDLKNKPVVKLDIPPPVRRLTAAPSPHLRQLEWGMAGRSPLDDPSGPWTCSRCIIGNKAEAEKCIRCNGTRAQIQHV